MKTTATHRSPAPRLDCSKPSSQDDIGDCGSGCNSFCGLEPLLCSIQYKTGMVYKGYVSSLPRSGVGCFQWPSGLQYTGGFKENKMEGHGELTWPDQSRYEGHFHNDMREGYGKHTWTESGEVYIGGYHHDKRHGKGTYTWPSGASFTGMFKDDLKEGFGVYISPQGKKYEGMYCAGKREGEGVITYPGGRQDIGIWSGSKLIRLKFTIKEAFTDHRLPLPIVRSYSQVPYMESRYKGHLEVASQEFIQGAADGDLSKVQSIMDTDTVHVDVVDKEGHGALFSAAIHGHTSILNFLLDNGADVNQLDDEGISILNVCHHLQYGSHPRVRGILDLLESQTEQKSGGGFFSSPNSPRKQFVVPMLSVSTCGQFNISPESGRLLLPGDEPEQECGLRRVKSFPAYINLADRRMQFMSDEERNGPLDRSNFVTTSKYIYTSSASNENEVQRSISLPTLLKSGTSRTLFGNSSKSLLIKTASAQGEVLGVSPNSSLSPRALSESDLLGGASALDPPFTKSRPRSRQLDSPVPLQDNSSSPSSPPSSPFRNFSSQRPVTSSVSPTMPSSSKFQKESFGPRPLRTSTPDRIVITSSRTTKRWSRSSTPLCVGEDSAGHRRKVNPLTLSPAQRKKILIKMTLGITDNYSSSAFSSSQYGSAVSAVQNTSISCVDIDDSVTSCTGTPLQVERSRPVMTFRDIIKLLLNRGADPNASFIPMHPLFYAITAGDVEIVKRLLECGAKTDHFLPEALGGYSPLHVATKFLTADTASIVEVLLQHGADPNAEILGDIIPRTTATLQHDEVIDVEGAGENGTEEALIAGGNEGTSGATPLHIVCATNLIERRPNTKSLINVNTQLAGIVSAVTELLLKYGADMNKVTSGHSALSLAILRGHDKAVELLLEAGADPNLPLGRRTGSAICMLTTPATHKIRAILSSASSLVILHKLMLSGADIFSPIEVNKNEIGNVVDFAYRVFKQDKKLSSGLFSSLTKLERSSYRSFKRLMAQLVHFFRCKALLTLSSEWNVWQVLQLEPNSPPEPTNGRDGTKSTTTRIISEQVDTSHNVSWRPTKNGGTVRKRGVKSTSPSVQSYEIILPEITLNISLNALAKTIEGVPDEDEDKRTFPQFKKKKLNRPDRYKELFERTTEILNNYEKAMKKSRERVWNFSSFCYECGRVLHVYLTRCSGCSLVRFCSYRCRTECRKKGHNVECDKHMISSTTSSSSPSRKSTSPSRSMSMKFTSKS